MRGTTHEQDVDEKVSTTTSLEENTERREENGEADEGNETGHDYDLAGCGTYMICGVGDERLV